MIPGMNPRDMAKAMKKMGIKQEDIEALEVIGKKWGTVSGFKVAEAFSLVRKLQTSL